MAQFRPLFLDTGSIEVVAGNIVTDFIHFPVIASSSSLSSSYSTLLPDPYLFSTMSANITNAVNTTSSSLFQFRVPNRQENYFYAHNSIVGVTTSATTTGVRIGTQRDNRADGIANIKVSSTLTAHTIACVGSFTATTFALPASMVAINTVYPCFVKALYNNSTGSVPMNNVVLLQPETNNTVTAVSGSVSYNKFIGYNFNLRDRTFNIGTGFTSSLGTAEEVSTIAIQPDGKIVVAGLFTSYNGTTQNYITRLNSNGTRDTSFNIGTGFDAAPVFSIAIQPDGKIVAGGGFTSYSGSTQIGIARINSNGTVDTSFNTGIGFDGGVNEIKIQSDGKILAGGSFTSYSGSTQIGIARLNSDGTVDTSFNTGTGFDPPSIYTIAIQPDGKIVAAGTFTSYSGSAQNYITRLNSDGTVDTSFNVGTGIIGDQIYSIDLQTNGKIVVAGNFTSYSGSTQNSIARLNSDGTVDTSFSSGIGPNNSIVKLATQLDGKIVIAGLFTSYSGSTQNYITRLNSDGTVDTSFNVGLGFNDGAYSLAIQTDRKIVVGGGFTSYNLTTQNRIIRLIPEFIINEKSTPLHLFTGSLIHITGSDTVSSSFLPITSSVWLSQSLATNVANTSNTAYATVFTLTGLTTGQRYLANLYVIGQSAAAATGLRMRVATGSAYRGTLYIPTSTTAPAIQNSADGSDITNIAPGTWPTVNTKYLVYGDYTFIKGATDPRVEIISETAATAVTAFSGSVIFYRAIN